MQETKNSKSGFQFTKHILFVAACSAILYFLISAPAETTSKLPHDDNHEEFFAIKSKKAAEVSCVECHTDDGIAPLPEKHPPKYRCLFCHKRD